MVLAVNVHGTASANALTATPPEDERGILLILDLDEGVEHHLSRLVEVKLVVLETRLLGGVVRVPAVDLEGPHLLGLLSLGGFADGRHGSSKHGRRGSEGSTRELGAEHPRGGRAESGHFCVCGRLEREGEREQLLRKKVPKGSEY